jgi:hypothetical protein
LQDRANASTSVTAATAPPIMPSIAARHTSCRVGRRRALGLNEIEAVIYRGKIGAGEVHLPST